MKLKEGGFFTKYRNETENTMNQLASMKMIFDDELHALLPLSSLLDSWETSVLSLSNSALDGVISMSQVTSSLLNE